MSVSPVTRKEASALRRSAILDAARAVFARQGYADTVVDDIATQAGIGKGTVYLYFSSKEQLYLGALLEDARRLHEESREAMARANTWREKLRAYVDIRMRYFETNQDFLRIYMTEFRSMCMQGKPLSPELHRLAEQGEAQLAQMFAAAAARGEIRPVDPELAAQTVSDLTRGLIERRLGPSGRQPAPGDAEFTLDLVCRALEP
jgi:AcrR family transcriptional regulator